MGLFRFLGYVQGVFRFLCQGWGVFRFLCQGCIFDLNLGCHMASEPEFTEA